MNNLEHHCIYAYTGFLECVQLMAGIVGVNYHQTGTNNYEVGINVHGISILKGQHMYVVFLSKMPSHPFNAFTIGNL